MKTPFKAPFRSVPTLALLAVSLLAMSCGKQDLYEIPDSPFPVIGHLPLPSINEGSAVLGDYAYVAAGQAGMHIVDISNPANPILVSTINTTKYAESVRVLRTFVNNTVRDIAMVVEGTEGVTTYDITNPLNAFSFDQGTTAVDANQFFLEVPGDPNEPFIGYLAESWKGVRIFWSIPGSPGVLFYPGVFGSTRGFALDIEVKDGWAYVADDQMGLAVVDVRVLELGQVELYSWADTPGNAVGIDVVGDYAYVADKRQGMTIFKIDGGATPEWVSQIALDSWCLDVEVMGHYAFIAADDAGLHVVDVSDPYHPVYAGSARSPNATSVHVTQSGLVLLTDEDAGLYILQGPAFADVTPPARIYSLEAEALSFVRIGLSWYVSGDDSYLGTATSQEIRWSSSPITSESAWNAATVIAGVPVPAAPGTHINFELTGLSLGTTYHFAMKVTDDEGQSSPLSVPASATTLASGTYLRSPIVDPLFSNPGATYTYEVTYQDAEGDSPVTASVVIDGTPNAMTYVSGDFNDLALFRYSTVLATGTHEYYFTFDDGQGNVVTTDTVTGPIVAESSFDMGSPLSEDCREIDETQHTVTLGREIFTSPYEVTQDEWETLMPSNPSTFSGSDLPVDGVTWYEAVAYCNALSLDEGYAPAYTIVDDMVTWDVAANGWRLPTEAEWEWLCRAGTATAFFTGDIEDCSFSDNLADAGWYLDNAGAETHPVGEKEANAWGLYDMHGNVMEWCWDHAGDYPEIDVLDPIGPVGGVSRIARGGSWDQQAMRCRSAARTAHVPDSRNDFMGFRVVRTIAN